MYSLDINFLNDRPEYRAESTPAAKAKAPAGSQLPLIAGIAVGLLAPALAMGAWFFLENRVAELSTTQTKLESELKELDEKLKQAEALKAQAKQINTEADALAGVFNQIKPWASMLRDLSIRTPPNVRIDSVTQADTILEINGNAQTFNDVNDFLLSLQQSAFLKSDQTQLLGTSQIPNPIGLDKTVLEITEKTKERVELPPIVSYKIKTALNDVPASEILRELEQNRAVGLVTRIRTLQDKGVLKQ